jgi:hypothetical protein
MSGMPRWWALLALVAPVAACVDHGPTESPPRVPHLLSASVAPNPTNSLSAVVTYTADGADSARLAYWSDTEPVAFTPYYRINDGRGTITALGLAPGTAYHGRVEVVGAAQAVATGSIAFASGDLPAALQGVRLQLSGTGAPPPGYLLTDLTVPNGDGTVFAVAFDRSGAIRWYRGFQADPGEHALAAEQQADGHFTLFVGSSRGWEPVAGRYYEFTAAGDSLAMYTAGASFYTDPHDLLLRSDGSGDRAAYLFGYDLRSVDLTSLGGSANQLVAGHVILRQSASGAVQFQWSAWDHFTLAEWVGRPPNLAQLTSIDFDHPNSIELDPAGNYIVSFASLTQIVNIDAGTGAMRWRFGGQQNQFTLVGDPLGGFGIQHDVRLLPDGDLLVFDNGNFHNPPESRVVEYRLDAQAMTATLVWQYRHSPPVFTPFVGSAQRYQNGRTLVGFAAAGLMTEVGADGTVLWEGHLTAAGQPAMLFYRVRQLPSLYTHQLP